MEKYLEQQPSSILKIAIVGPESTGKTTLAEQLAIKFDTVWAPEFARDYLQKKWDTFQTTCEPEDLLQIAKGQIQLENDRLCVANKILFCDTTLLVTKVYSEYYFKYCDPILDQAVKNNFYDLVFLTNIDIPWQADDLRDKPNERTAIFTAYTKTLHQNNTPYIVLSGNKQERLQKATQIINDVKQAIAIGLNAKDFVQLFYHGITLDKLEQQLRFFKKGIPKTILERPAIKEDGILVYSTAAFNEFTVLFESKKNSLKLKKFVPASGAASRMFKFLSEFLISFNLENDTINAYINRKNDAELAIFITGIEKFPFYKQVLKKIKNDFPDFKDWNRDRKIHKFITYLIGTEFLNYTQLPKGVLPFHDYNSNIVTPLEEHLKESAYYAASNGTANLHFTVSEAHQHLFQAIINKTKYKFEAEKQLTINTNFSYQSKATDTIAVNHDNTPFRNENGCLVFRPGGHGALIENLNALDADLIFIKNIDNVNQNQIEEIAFYKKGLAGILLSIQEQVFDYLYFMQNTNIQESDLSELILFAQNALHCTLVDDFNKYTLENKIATLVTLFNRPIRVCGMVFNEGEPGGGPYWVKDSKGNVSLQIVESSQVDLSNENQAILFNQATHFNPVDLVCGIKNYKNEKFNLLDFIDFNSGLIVSKNSNGLPIKGYELPGLWNGAMANWITLFVQVPLLTFNPVKTVNDLLKPNHQQH